MANTDALTQNRVNMEVQGEYATTIIVGDSLTARFGEGGEAYEPPTTGQLYPTGTEQD